MPGDGIEINAPGDEHGVEVVGWHRAPKEEPLGPDAPQGHQRPEVLGCLDTLCYHLDIQGVPEPDDGRHDGLVGGIVGQTGDEGLVHTTLTMATGRSFSWAMELCPVPKSSMAMAMAIPMLMQRDEAEEPPPGAGSG